jgi:hypothetical protein
MSNKSWMTEQEQKDLLKVFPPEAYNTCYFEGGGKGTSLREAYIIERLHEVFGLGMVRIVNLGRDLEKIGDHYIGHWTGELQFWGVGETERDLLGPAMKDMFLRFKISLMGQIEYKKKNDERKFQDAFKAMRTNAISKAVFENLLIGRELFKGEVKPGQAPKSEEEKRKEEAKLNASRQRAELKSWGKRNTAKIKTLIADTLGDDAPKIDDMTNVQLGKLYVAFTTNGLNQ